MGWMGWIGVGWDGMGWDGWNGVGAPLGYATVVVGMSVPL